MSDVPPPDVPRRDVDPFDASFSRVFETEVARHQARALGLPFVDLHEYDISPGILRRVPRDVSRRHRCVPMVHNHRRVTLVVDGPLSASVLATMPEDLFPPGATIPAVEFAFTSPSAMDRSLERQARLPVRAAD